MTSMIGRRLAALLAERNMSQKQLAEATNLTPAAVSRYVSGAREPRAITIAAMAKALGVKPVDITGDAAARETDDAIELIARNAHSLTDEQKRDLIAALVTS